MNAELEVTRLLFAQSFSARWEELSRKREAHQALIEREEERQRAKEAAKRGPR